MAQGAFKGTGFILWEQRFPGKAADFTAEFLEKYMKTGDKGAGSGENYSRILWAFFIFQKWYESYIH